MIWSINYKTTIIMKILKLFFFLLMATLLSCCNKDDDKPIAEIDKLPPATQTGANTAGCLVNGLAFLPGGQSQQPLSCNYLDGENFSLKISNKYNGQIKTILIYIYNTSLITGQTYQLTENESSNSKFAEYIIYNSDFSEFHYQTTSSVVGELTITAHNFDNATISGTFWFDAKFEYAENYSGEVDDDEIIEIREGRFDMEY